MAHKSKILHITTNNNFVNQAIRTFEAVYPGQNQVWVIKDTQGLHDLSCHCDKLFSRRQTISPVFLSKLGGFDLVVLHSFVTRWYPLVLLAPRGVRFAWLGWGYDYYGYINSDPKSLLLGETLKLDLAAMQARKTNIKSVLKWPFSWVLNHVVKPLALRRIASFSPVLREDYDLVAEAELIPSLPKFIPWNYGSLEEDLVKGFLGKRVSGGSVLLGNSASFTNNHVEVFALLNKLKLVDRLEVVVPLSYGDDFYKRSILEIGQKILGRSFFPLTGFMPIDEYVKKVQQCGYVIMNHKRQQAVGNIVIMLYLGARVFLRAENPVYKMFKKEGAVLNTVAELESNPSLLNTPLSEKQIQANIDVLYRHWSLEAINLKTKNLVDYHLGGGG